MKLKTTSLLSIATRTLLAAAALAAVPLPGARAAVPAYGIDGNGFLRLIPDLNTMASVVLAPTQFFNGGVNAGLAIAPLGQLYAGDANGDIFSLALNGTATLLGNPGQGPITGLDWDPIASDLLVLSASPASQIFHASPVNGSLIGSPTPANIPGQAEDIAWLASGLGYVTFLAGAQTWVARMDLTTGNLILGTPAMSSDVDNWTGVDIDPATNIAYMIGWLDDSWQITDNAGNLTATQLIATGNHLDWTALAIQQVPEPSTAALLLGSGAAAALRRQRRTG